MKFTYSSGQRPLDGYTIKRGIGRGGFGEVYYGVSDGGKEVGLKLIHGNQDVELRGVAQCLNLKHPNLVNLYDMKTDPQGGHWVIMEYVSGEPLSVVLNRHPKGLSPELARQWFQALAQAVGYLHDHGIVHRDLKPGNIFLENGTLKVGDYGLSKFIGASQRSAQTQSVGTVHYMAPEISTGNYNKQIDIYASGIILYEMLTGHVPFDGESAGEILMKHLTAPPDLSKVPEEFVPILAKALCKNPAHRYAGIAEMARAVADTIQEPQVAVAAPHAEMRSPASPRRPMAEPVLTVLPAVTPRGQLAELCGSLALSAVFAAVGVALWAALARAHEVSELGTLFFLTVGASWAILIPAKFWGGKRGDSWTRRLVMMALGALLGLGALYIEGWVPRTALSQTSEEPRRLAQLLAPLGYFALAFFGLRWWRMTDRRRSQWFSLGPIFAAGCWGLILLGIWSDPWRGTLVLSMSAAIVQLVSPWEQPPPPTSRRMRLRYA
ncbi:MAG: serine/threonine protein kinase [Gemmataceae bacterium]